MTTTRKIPEIVEQALSIKDFGELQTFINANPNIQPITQFAAKVNAVNILELLHQSGQLTHELSVGNTHLLWAIANTSLDSALFLIEHVPEVIDTPSSWMSSYELKHSPLTLSVAKGWSHVDTEGVCQIPQSEVVKKLIEKGADINYQNADGYSALHLACLQRNLNAIVFLIENGASLTCQTYGGEYHPFDLLFFSQQAVHNVLNEQAWVYTFNSTYFAPENFHFFAETLKKVLPDLDKNKLIDCLFAQQLSDKALALSIQREGRDQDSSKINERLFRLHVEISMIIRAFLKTDKNPYSIQEEILRIIDEAIKHLDDSEDRGLLVHFRDIALKMIDENKKCNEAKDEPASNSQFGFFNKKTPDEKTDYPEINPPKI